MKLSEARLKEKSKMLWFLLMAFLIVGVLPLALLAVFIWVAVGLVLHVAVWCCWNVRGRYVLFVYSDSPTWHDYLEERVLPRLGKRAVVLNWSERKRWRITLPVLVFRYFGGHRSFNPMAVVFRPFRLARKFCFYEPFRDYKCGHAAALTAMEQEFCALMDDISPSGK